MVAFESLAAARNCKIARAQAEAAEALAAFRTWAQIGGRLMTEERAEKAKAEARLNAVDRAVDRARAAAAD